MVVSSQEFRSGDSAVGARFVDARPRQLPEVAQGARRLVVALAVVVARHQPAQLLAVEVERGRPLAAPAFEEVRLRRVLRVDGHAVQGAGDVPAEFDAVAWGCHCRAV